MVFFKQLPELSKSTALEKSAVEEQAGKLDLAGPKLAAIRVVFEWSQLLTAETPELFNQLRTFHQSVGNVPCAPTRSPAPYQKNPEAVLEARDRLLEQISQGTLTAEVLTKADPQRLKQLLVGLNTPQIELLQSMTAQRINVESLDVTSLTENIPFPITKFNFFGRFLAGACETPQQAARHLTLANPFLIRIRSLLEGLQNDQLNFIQLDVISQAEVDALNEGARPPARASAKDETRAEILEIVHAAINASGDFYAGQIPGDKPVLTTIAMPRLPDIADDHIDRKLYSELSVVLFDWLFFGERSSELLYSSSLTPQQETHAARRAAALRAKELELEKHMAATPARNASTREIREWKQTETKINRHISRIEDDIAKLNEQREAIIPIIKQLDAFASHTSELNSFRREIAAAQRRGARIVFSFVAHKHCERGGNILDFMDPAYNARRFQQHRAVKLLKESSFLLSPDATRRIHAGKIPSPFSISERNTRTFEIPTSDLNVSTRYVVAGIMPRREDPRLSSLIDTIAKHLPPPGVSSSEQLRRLVKLNTGKRAITPADYVSYAMERLPRLSERQLLRLMKSLQDLKQTELPERVVKLAVERFNHPPHILRAYERYTKGYQPSTLGQLPPIFTNQASFPSYLKLGMDALGMASEVAEIQRHLVERGIVAIVDGTNYHPELDASIAMTGDKLEKGDSEKTEEIWGEYVRPSERVIRALSVRLMEGDVAPELKNSTLVGIVKLDKVDQVKGKIVKKFYGLDVGDGPELSEINQVLADLKLHDDNPILIIEARSIKSLEEYRKFLSLLEHHEIKVILRTREALPGIPQVNIQPFLPNAVADRVLADAARLDARLDLAQPITPDLVDFAASQVQRCRAPQQDPLNLTLQVLDAAASQARLQPDRRMTHRDITAALAPIFHLPDGKQLQLRIKAVDHFVKNAPNVVLGQEKAIELLGRRIKGHFARMRNELSPLTILLPGPTGVGKTELMMMIAKDCDLPFFLIEGAEFSEEHSIARLVGSPSGYVGPDEGILFTFLEENSDGLIFIDELEKAHPAMNQHLMNFYDKGTLTAGDGRTITRSSMIIVGASNAGADRLHRDMDTREVKQVLAEYFVDRFGRPRPELIGRFEPIVMLAIEEPAFRQMLHKSLESLGTRSGFINANLRLVGFDEAASKLLYEKTRAVCEFNGKSLKRPSKMGFGNSTDDLTGGLFYDLRHVNRAIDDLAGDSLTQLAVEQYESGAYEARDTLIKVKLIGDPENEKIHAVPVND